MVLTYYAACLHSSVTATRKLLLCIIAMVSEHSSKSREVEWIETQPQ